MCLNTLSYVIILPFLICIHTAADFTTTPQTVVFPIGSVPGQPPQCIDIPITDDVLVELLESFSVTATSTDPNVEFSPGGNQAVVTITDNDSK